MQELNFDVKGLYSDFNQFSQTPPGALSLAENGVLERRSIFQSRRGFKQFNSTLTAANKLFEYEDTLIVHDSSTFRRDNGAGGWTAYSGTFGPALTNARIQSITANNNIYFLTNLGMQRLDSLAGTITQASTPRALDASASTTGGSGFLPNNENVAYRIVWGFEDANGNLILGAPSSRVVVENTSGGSRDVSLTFTIPSTITTSFFYQVYRSVTSTASPNDELLLAIQDNPTAGEITAGVITLTDSTPQDNLGAALYTNPTQEGILQSNAPAPYAYWTTQYNGYSVLARTNTTQEIFVRMAQVPAVNDTITINSVVYTAKAAETIASGEFDQSSGDITTTMRSLIRVINRYASNTDLYAYEVDSTSFIIRARTFAISSYTLTSSDTDNFEQALPITSTNNTRKNGLSISKFQQPESYPNELVVGDASKEILGVRAVRDALFIFKEDGVFRITGIDFDNWVLEEHDPTIELIGYETLQRFENFVLGFSNKGVFACSNAGIDLISRQIEQELLEYSEITNFDFLATGISYDRDRKYLLSIPVVSSDLESSKIYIYNGDSGEWTRWAISARAGIAKGDTDILYLIRSSDEQVLEERKSRSRLDYADDEFDITITSAPTSTTIVVASATNLAIGQLIKQGASEAIITDIAGTTITLDTAGLPWTAAAAVAYNPILVQCQFVANDLENPGLLKHYRELSFIFRDTQFGEITFKSQSPLVPGTSSVDLTVTKRGAWGAYPWGSTPWGGGFGGAKVLRTFFPRKVSRSTWVSIQLDLERPFTTMELEGLSVIYNPMDSRKR